MAEDPKTAEAAGAGMVRVVQLSRQDVVDRRREVVEADGLRLAFLEQKERAEGRDALVEWLEDHNFWDLAENWRSWAYLLGE